MYKMKSSHPRSVICYNEANLKRANEGSRSHIASNNIKILISIYYVLLTTTYFSDNI